MVYDSSSRFESRTIFSLARKMNFSSREFGPMGNYESDLAKLEKRWRIDILYKCLKEMNGEIERFIVYTNVCYDPDDPERFHNMGDDKVKFLGHFEEKGLFHKGLYVPPEDFYNDWNEKIGENESLCSDEHRRYNEYSAADGIEGFFKYYRNKIYRAVAKSERELRLKINEFGREEYRERCKLAMEWWTERKRFNQQFIALKTALNKMGEVELDRFRIR